MSVLRSLVRESLGFRSHFVYDEARSRMPSSATWVQRTLLMFLFLSGERVQREWRVDPGPLLLLSMPMPTCIIPSRVDCHNHTRYAQAG